MDIDTLPEMFGRLYRMQNRGEISADAKKRDGLARISPRCEKRNIARKFATNITAIPKFKGMFRYLGDIYNMNSLKLRPSIVNLYSLRILV